MDLADKLNSLRQQPPAYWATAANQYLPGWLTILFVIVIAWYLVKIVWLLIPTDNTIAIGSPQTASQTTTANRAAVNFPMIASAHLFGIAGEQPPPIKTVNAPETRLNLKLRGAIAADDEAVAHAIIADGGGQDKVYFVKDKLPGGATLHEVYTDRVILNRNGVLETLRLPKLSSASSQPAQGNSQPAVVGAIPQMIKEDPVSFSDVIRPQPFMPDGQLAGYRLYPGRDRRKFAALGLRPGDLVTDINGTPLNDPQAGMETFRNLGSASQVIVTIERGSTSMVLTLDPDQLASMGGGPPGGANR